MHTWCLQFYIAVSLISLLLIFYKKFWFEERTSEDSFVFFCQHICMVLPKHLCGFVQTFVWVCPNICMVLFKHLYGFVQTFVWFSLNICIVLTISNKVLVKTLLPTLDRLQMNQKGISINFFNDSNILTLCQHICPILSSPSKVLLNSRLPQTLDTLYKWPLPYSQRTCWFWCLM